MPLSHILHWEGIQLAKKEGYRRYDFGGYWDEAGDCNPINRFKLGFSKQIDQITGQYIYTVKPLRQNIAHISKYLRDIL